MKLLDRNGKMMDKFDNKMTIGAFFQTCKVCMRGGMVLIWVLKKIILIFKQFLRKQNQKTQDRNFSFCGFFVLVTVVVVVGKACQR